jgi:hypothetical protein
MLPYLSFPLSRVSSGQDVAHFCARMPVNAHDHTCQSPGPITRSLTSLSRFSASSLAFLSVDISSCLLAAPFAVHVRALKTTASISPANAVPSIVDNAIILYRNDVQSEVC